MYTTRIDEYIVEIVSDYTSITDTQLDELKNGAVLHSIRYDRLHSSEINLKV